MIKPERQRIIVDFVNQHGAATVEELARAARVSPATIRRDLTYLNQDRTIFRTHGGAIVYHQSTTEELPIDVRLQMHKAEKELVAMAAVELIQDGSTIYIGAGTTGRALSSKLRRFRNLTVLTNDIDVAREVALTENTLIVAGGQMKRNSRTLYGFYAEQMLRELQVDAAFMITDALDVKDGFMDYGVDEINLKRMVIRNAKRCVMLCDSTKFNSSAFVNVCPLSAVDVVVTNAEARAEDTQALRDAGLQVVQAPRK